MTRRGLATALCLGAALGAGAGPPEVSVDGLEVRIVAEASQLDELLTELAGATGMEVVYEESPPCVSVTAELRAATHAEAVIRLLDGLALNYALQLDADGERVTTLWIAGQGRGSRPRPRPAPARAPARRPPQPAAVPVAVEEQPDAPVSEEEPETTDPAAPPGPVIFPQASPTPLRLPTPGPPGATPTPAPRP